MGFMEFFGISKPKRVVLASAPVKEEIPVKEETQSKQCSIYLADSWRLKKGSFYHFAKSVFGELSKKITFDIEELMWEVTQGREVPQPSKSNMKCVFDFYVTREQSDAFIYAMDNLIKEIRMIKGGDICDLKYYTSLFMYFYQKKQETPQHEKISVKPTNASFLKKEASVQGRCFGTHNKDYIPCAKCLAASRCIEVTNRGETSVKTELPSVDKPDSSVAGAISTDEKTDQPAICDNPDGVREDGYKRNHWSYTDFMAFARGTVVTNAEVGRCLIVQLKGTGLAMISIEPETLGVVGSSSSIRPALLRMRGMPVSIQYERGGNAWYLAKKRIGEFADVAGMIEECDRANNNNFFPRATTIRSKAPEGTKRGQGKTKFVVPPSGPVDLSGHSEIMDALSSVLINVKNRRGPHSGTLLGKCVEEWMDGKLSTMKTGTPENTDVPIQIDITKNNTIERIAQKEAEIERVNGELSEISSLIELKRGDLESMERIRSVDMTDKKREMGEQIEYQMVEAARKRAIISQLESDVALLKSVIP